MSFDINQFRVKRATDTQAPAVCIPTKAFRINPDDATGRITDVLVSCIEKRWFLVAPEAEQVMLDAGYNVFRANLYEGVRATGQRIVMPITYNADGNYWMNSAIAMMKAARKEWVTREADSANCRYLVKVDASIHQEPEWSGDFIGLIEEAFGDRVVTLDHPLVARRKACRRHEELDEFARKVSRAEAFEALA